MTIIAPSLLACDLSQLASEAKRAIAAGADWLHLDVMDGHFVPNISFGPPVIKCLSQHVNTILDCHLMITNPTKYIAAIANAGATFITFHLECDDDPESVIECIRKHGCRPSISIKPSTLVSEKFLELVDKCDMVLVMTVEPGFGGQSFMSDQLIKVKQLRDRFPLKLIQVDGGLSLENVASAKKHGANVIVAGSFLFNSLDMKKDIESLRQLI